MDTKELYDSDSRQRLHGRRQDTRPDQTKRGMSNLEGSEPQSDLNWRDEVLIEYLWL
jgi:hypothetical protein